MFLYGKFYPYAWNPAIRDKFVRIRKVTGYV